MEIKGEENGKGELLSRLAEPTRSGTSLLSQFFIFPLVIVIVGVGIFILFGLIGSENKSAADYIRDLKRSDTWLNSNSRLQAAYELSKILATSKNKGLSTAVAADLVAIFDKAREGRDDPKLKQYLAIALGHLQDPRAIKSLMQALADEDGKTRVYSAYALGELNAAEAVPDLITVAANKNDHDARKMAIYVLGTIIDTRAIPVLKAALNDPTEDITWNAALSLARYGDRSGRETLLKMMDRAYLSKVNGMRDDQKENAIVNAIKASVLLNDKSMESTLRSLSRNDPSLKVRETALEALKHL